MLITVQRGTPAKERMRRRDLRKRIFDLNIKFMLTDDDIEAIGGLQKEYYALLVQADSERAALTAAEKKHLKVFDTTIGRTDHRWIG